MKTWKPTDIQIKETLLEMLDSGRSYNYDPWKRRETSKGKVQHNIREEMSP